MAEKTKTLKVVRITRDNEKRLRDYIRKNEPCPTIQAIVNFALQKFLLDQTNNNNEK